MRECRDTSSKVLHAQEKQSFLKRENQNYLIISKTKFIKIKSIIMKNLVVLRTLIVENIISVVELVIH